MHPAHELAGLGYAELALRWSRDSKGNKSLTVFEIGETSQHLLTVHDKQQ
jgi:hypothetical protein